MKISKVIIYTKDFNKKINYPVDVILSPSFYWIKKIDIPIKSLFQAKKIAKNLFDLEEKEYIFDAIKIGNKYFAIAINKNLDLKIDKKYIKSLRLAQVELYNYECINITDKNSLKKIEDILFCFPKDENCKKFEEIENIKLSNYTVSLDTINLDKSSLFLIFASFIFIIVYFLIGIVEYKKNLNSLKEKEASLSKYNLPLTTFQLDAIYANLKNIDNTQKRIRKDLEIFSKTPLKKNEEYIKLSFNKFYEVKIKTSSNLDNYFNRYFNILESNLKNKIYSAKLKDE